MHKRFYAIVFLIAMFTRAAFSQGGAQQLELSLSESISYYTKKSFQIGAPQSSTPIDITMQLRSNKRHEVRFNFLGKNRFGGEAFYSYESTAVDFNRTTPPAETLSIPLNIHHFGVNFLYYPIGTETSRWRPFVNVGGGSMIYRPTTEGQTIATDPLRGNLPDFFEASKPAVNFGVGLKRSITRSFGLRFDIGNITTAAPTFGLPTESTNPNAAVLPIKGRTNNTFASIGFILYLGR